MTDSPTAQLLSTLLAATSHLGAFALLATTACSQAQDPSSEVRLVVSDGNAWHVHEAGKDFEVRVARSGASSAKVVAEWVDAKGKRIGSTSEIPHDRETKLRSPRNSLGYLGLRFACSDASIAFPPQPAGVRSQEYGFAILPPAPPTSRKASPDSPFGVVHAAVKVAGQWDPYLRGHHIKTLTWNTLADLSWKQGVQERFDHGLLELPILSGAGWDSPGDKAIDQSALDTLAARFASYTKLSALSDWELGIEENWGGRFDREPLYFANLARKAEAVRNTLRKAHPSGRTVYNIEGFKIDEWRRFLDSPAAAHFDVFSSHPYRWPDFPEPTTWLAKHLQGVRQVLVDKGRGKAELWLTEFGIPVRGNNDPQGFFGYPASNKQVPGATRDYAARYLVKYHAIALQHGVKRLYLYNYQNRANDVRAAEDHFGLRSYAPKGSAGFPLPAYVAWVTLTLQLHGKSFVALRQPKPKIWLFEFADASERTVLAWVEGTVAEKPTWAQVFGDNVKRPLPNVVDLYGTPQGVESAGLELRGDPLYVTTAR